MFRRLAGTWTYWGWKHGYFASEDDARSYFDEMCYLLQAKGRHQIAHSGLTQGCIGLTGLKGILRDTNDVDPETEF